MADLRRRAETLITACLLTLAAGLFLTTGALTFGGTPDLGPVDPEQKRQTAEVVKPADPISPAYRLPTLTGELAWTSLDARRNVSRFAGVPATARPGDQMTVWVHQRTGHPALEPWRVRPTGPSDWIAGGAAWLGLGLLAAGARRLFRLPGSPPQPGEARPVGQVRA